MQRTNTTGRTTFDLPGPRAVTFTFLPLDRWMAVLAELEAEGPQTESAGRADPPPPGRAMRISIPVSSTWSMVHHWHPSQNGCTRTNVLAPPTTCTSVTCVEGRFAGGAVYTPHTSNAQMYGPGNTTEFSMGARVAWGKASGRRGQPLTADLVANQVLWRNVCSAVLDRDLFPRLQSTPRWFKTLFYRCLGKAGQKKLLDRILDLQLQCIYYAHDLHTNHGPPLPLSRFWGMPFQQAPQWVYELDWRAEQIAAWVVMFTIRWVCRLFLGMKGQYTEYSTVEVMAGEQEDLEAGGKAHTDGCLEKEALLGGQMQD